MSFRKVKVWDNRETKNGVYHRTWTRRITWLVNEGGQVKLKLQDGAEYREVLVLASLAQTVWDRFKAGQGIEDAVSILASEVPLSLASKKMKQ